MPEQLIDLDEEERALVHAHRQQKKEERDRLTRRLLVLELALSFESWLQKHERGSSFSTFVNEFGCDDPNHAKLYESVQAIRALLN
ncbi:TPA: hypothetical protein L4U31_002860 [Pseudomonas aeruginosa]|nr:hypothetical protein [Pseudomonas aeruginosa]